MDVNRKYAALCAVIALVQRQRCFLHLLLLRRRKRRRDDFIFRCRPLHADPVRAPRMYVKRRARNRDTSADAPERTGNALYFRDWRDGSTFSQYLNLTPPNDYEPEPECEAVLRGEFAAKIRLPFHTFHALYERMNTDAFMEERSTACPLKIKLTGALLYLAYGCPWDAVENQVNVDKRTLRDWFWNQSWHLRRAGAARAPWRAMECRARVFEFKFSPRGRCATIIRDDTDPLDVTSHEPPQIFTSNFCPEAKIRSGEAKIAQFRLAKS